MKFTAFCGLLASLAIVGVVMASDVRPVITSIQPVAGGVGVVYYARPGSRCVVQVSVDCRHWTSVATNVSTDVLRAYIDTNAAPFRFYRICQ